MFRSTVEVVQFIMEAMETPESNSLLEQGPATAMKGSLKKKRSSSKKDKISTSKSLKISSAEKTDVERFLEESHNNLQNICGCRWVAPGSEEWEKYMNPSSEEEDNASSDEETQ
ncbi:hypothetical protein NL676_034403 [Syzygium grande]|nr:hypothetical protein NL676_034403 [Syzygium grande]